MIEVKPTSLAGVLEIVPRRFGDDRGFFSETYNRARFLEAGVDLTFVQDNHSYSANKGVLRGLHYQVPPFPQAKLLRVTRGAILDVAVDIRRSSPTFRQWVAVELSAEKWNQLLVPVGFAHGFLTLQDHTEVLYKTTEVYAPEQDRAIRFDDPEIGVEWPGDPAQFQLSAKDRAAPLLSQAEVFD